MTPDKLSIANWIKITNRPDSKVKFLLYPGCESQLTMDLMSLHCECTKRWPLETYHSKVVPVEALSDVMIEVVKGQGPQHLRTERAAAVILAIAWADNALVDVNEQPKLGDIVNAIIALLDDSGAPEH